MAYRTLDDIDIKGKRVLVRADLNVPMKNGVVTDRTRIERQAATIKELADKHARVIVLSHLDRPGGKVVPGMSLKPLAAALAGVLGRTVAFAEDCVGPVADGAVAKLRDGDVLLLENTRFHPGEEKNGLEFAKALAALGDIYVNDAFSAAHRAHASTEGIAHLLPSAAGRSMQAELTHLGKALDHPERPVMAVIGGGKISTKISSLEKFFGQMGMSTNRGALGSTLFAGQSPRNWRSLA